MHEDDGVVAILPCHGRGQAEHIFRLGGASHGLKADGGQVVTFVNNELPVSGHDVGHLALPDQALDGRNIDETRRPLLSTADDPNTICLDVEEGAQPRHPLIQQLLPMHQDQRIGVSLGYQSASDDGLAECRRGCEHASVVRHQGIHGRLLLLGERTEKARPEGSTTISLVTQFGMDTIGNQKIDSSIDTAPR